MFRTIKNTVTPSTSTNFVDCGESNIKLELKEDEEETLDEDPLSNMIQAENVDKTVKQEIEKEIQDKDSDDDRINTIDIMENKVEI